MAKSYPRSISPCLGYRTRLPMRLLLLYYPGLTVVRRCDDPDPFAYSGTGKIRKLKDEVFADENLLEMSVNLLGGGFKIRHLAFTPLRQFVESDWSGKQEFDYSISDTYYNVEKTFGVIYFGVSQVNSYTFPYPKAVKKDEYDALKATGEMAKQDAGIDKELVGALGSAGNNMTEMQAWLHVNHHPKMLNYWHMQIDVYGVGHDGYFKYNEKSGEVRHVRQRIREYITHIAICETGTAYHIGRKYYQRNTSCIVDSYDTVVNMFCRQFVNFNKTY